MIEVEPIVDEASLQRSLAEVDRLMQEDPADGTPEAHRYHILGLMIEAYEAEHYPVDEDMDPIDLIRERVEQKGLSRRDLATLLGGENRVSEVLRRTRALTLPMIRRLSVALDLPASALIADYKLREGVVRPDPGGLMVPVTRGATKKSTPQRAPNTPALTLRGRRLARLPAG